MPRIPVARIPDVRRTNQKLAGYDGLPDHFGKIDISPVLQGLNSISKAGKSLQRFGEDLQLYEKRKQQADDAYNAGEVELAQQAAYQRAEERMLANPHDYKNFHTYAAEAEKEFYDSSREYMNKISEDRKRFVIQQMKRRGFDFSNRVLRLQAQTEVTNIYNGFKTQIRDAAMRGDPEFARRRLQEAQNLPVKVFSDAEYESQLRDIDRWAEYGAIRREIEGGSRDIADRLSERRDGQYANFRNLHESDRQKLASYAAYQENKRSADGMQKFCADANLGMCPTPEELDNQFMAGDLTEAEYNSRKAISAKYYREREEQSRKQTEHARKQTEQKRRLNELNADTKQKVMAAQLELMKVPMNPYETERFRSELTSRIAEAFPGDPVRQSALHKVMQQKLKQDDPLNTEKGKMAKQIADGLYQSEKFKSDDPDAGAKADNLLEAYKAVRLMLGEGRSLSDIQSRLTEMQKMQQERKISNLITSRGKLRDPKKAGKVFDSGDTGRDYLRANMASQSGFGGLGVITEAARRKREGWIDKADIVETRERNGRKLWKMRDGRTIYPDEYE